MTVYIVFRGGIYRHECLGIFSSLELATEAAGAATAIEPDDHHEITVQEFVVDVRTPINSVDHYKNPGYCEPPEIYRRKRT